MFMYTQTSIGNWICNPMFVIQSSESAHVVEMNMVGDFAKPMEVSGSGMLLSLASELLKDKQQCTGF